MLCIYNCKINMLVIQILQQHTLSWKSPRNLVKDSKELTVMLHLSGVCILHKYIKSTEGSLEISV